ncbi:MAG: hypothetical protein LBB72_06730 [Spirochaetaceae bacterium]|jgi:hypothetical protein|nr:hypothetical protein [Spirochaetaceae bacterium]
MSAVPTPAAVFRRRSGWEAADMGILLWQSNWLPLLLFLGIPAGILTVIEQIMPKNDAFTWGVALITWWIKPVLDRFCLQVVSVRFFEPRASFRRLFRGLFRTLTKGLAGDLLWRRFSPSRSAWQPLVVLEQQKGKQFRRRKELLSRNGLGFGPTLTFICIALMLVLEGGELVFLYGIADLIQNGYAGTIIDFIGEKNILVSILSLINLILVESLYVCMGFGLYINSRVETEGWDIELLFKKCVDTALRHKPDAAPHHASLSGTAAVLPLMFLLCFAVPVQAQENSPVEEILQPEQILQLEQISQPEPVILNPATISEQEQNALDSVFESPDFGKEKSTWRIRLKRSDADEPSGKKNRAFFPNLREILGRILRFVLGAALVVAAGFGAVYVYRHKDRLFPDFAGKSCPQQEGPDYEPRQLLEKAEELHRNGEIREAWALCFRAFIASFTRYFSARQFSLPVEATEYEALALVRKSAVENVDIKGFDLFVPRWVGFAYGGREPAAGMFEEALASCRSLLASGGEL